MKRGLHLLACISLGVMILTMSACSGAPQEKEYPDHYEQYAALLGETRETVLSRLNLTEQDLVPAANGLFSIPVTAQYSGLTFDMMLDFDRINDRLCGFFYTAEWHSPWEVAIRDVTALAGALTETFGEAREDIDPNRFSHMSEEALTEAFREASAKDMSVGTDYWLIEKRDDPVIREYVAALREQTDSSRAIADYLNLTLELQVGVSEASNSAGVLLRFRVETEYRSN